MNSKLKAVVVGCGAMGQGHIKLLQDLESFDLVAICDISEENLALAAEKFELSPYSDFQKMLDEEKPDVVSIVTGNRSHAPLAIAAAKSGVKGVYCEKPMSMNMREAKEMDKVCKENNCYLVVNHQRRMGDDMMETRRLIESGAIGDVQVIRGGCPGDILSDGSHAIDSVLFLAGDENIEWVFGQIHRDLENPPKSPQSEKPGYRFGHLVENGGTGVFMTKSNIRCEVACGDMKDGYRAYQDYEIIGTKGRIWRCGDAASPNLFISDSEGGEWISGISEQWVFKPLKAEDGKGIWRPVFMECEDEDSTSDNYSKNKVSAMSIAYNSFAESVVNEFDHPMKSENALRAQEVIMAIYESARLNKKITMPLEQMEYPLELMV